MLSIISMNRAGLSDGCLSVKVDFEFDNASTLPERVITVSGMSYIIAKDSTAKNVVTNVNYKYNGSKWVKVTETVEPVTGGTITDNGDYTITSNEYTGLSDISVDVSGGVGLPKIATPIAYNENALYVLQGLYSGSTSVMISKTYNSVRLPVAHPLYYVILQPISSIYFEYEFNGDKYGTIIFTALSNTINIKCYYGSQMTDVTYKADSPIKKDDFKEGKTYAISYKTTPKGSSIQYDTLVSVTEYDESITFTLE